MPHCDECTSTCFAVASCLGASPDGSVAPPARLLRSTGLFRTAASAVAVVGGDLADSAWSALPSGSADGLEPCSPALGLGGCGAVGAFVAAFARVISRAIRVLPAQVAVDSLAPASAESTGRWARFSVLAPTPAGLTDIEEALRALAHVPPASDAPPDDGYSALRVTGVVAVTTDCAPFFDGRPCKSSADCGGCARACWQGRCAPATAIDALELAGARAVALPGACDSAALSACDATCAVCDDVNT